MFEYQKYNKYFAQVTGKSEEICEKELIRLGAENTSITYRGIHFTADKKSVYKMNYCSRTATRILAPILTFSCHSENYITQTACKIEWDKFLNLNKTFAISATVSKSNITHSKYAALCLKDGICDYFNAKYKKRPNVDSKNPDVRFNLHIENNKAVINIDLSGESLHKRGYRLEAEDAPMQETLAAAILESADWNGENNLLDCMCGSGTILAEALMRYCNIPAQYLRKNFGFFNLPDFDKDLWLSTKKECDSELRDLPAGLITGSDKSLKAVKIAKDNLKRLPGGNKIEITRTNFEDIKKFENGTLIVNPPYGLRLSNPEEVESIYRDLGDFIKQKCTGTTAYIYTGVPKLKKYVGLRPSQKVPLVNGKLEGVLLKIESYEGSKKRKHRE